MPQLGVCPNLGYEKAIYLQITQHRPESKVSHYADIAATVLDGLTGLLGDFLLLCKWALSVGTRGKGAHLNVIRLKKIEEVNLNQSYDSESAGLQEADLHGLDLRGANLSSANLLRANLRNALLDGADLREANLCEADLTGASLTEADLKSALLIRATLQASSLLRADLGGARLLQANLSEANLEGANLTEADLSLANLYGANLTGASMIGANLCAANLRAALLRNADLSNADLTAADFEVADSSFANLYGANLAGAQFNMNKLAQAHPYRESVADYTSPNQLLAAAVVSKKFRQLLLSNPAQAISAGWHGQKFVFSPEEKQLLISIKARTLEEFASQLWTNLHKKNLSLFKETP